MHPAVGRGYVPDGFPRRGVHVSEVRNQCAEIKNRRGRSPDLRGAVIPSAARDPGRSGNSSLAALGPTRTGKVPDEDRKSVRKEKSVSVHVEFGGRRLTKTKKTKTNTS